MTMVGYEPYFHPDDPAGWLGPDDCLMVDGLDWSWAFVWYKELPRFPGYSVGTNGIVWSHKQRGTWSKIALRRKDRGPLEVAIYGADRKRHFVLVHRLALEAFISECPDSLEACHDPDPDPTNNHIRNLRWDTRSANAMDLLRRTPERFGFAGKIKINEVIAGEIRSLSAQGLSRKEIESRYRLSRSNISKIINNQIWRAR